MNEFEESEIRICIETLCAHKPRGTRIAVLVDEEARGHEAVLGARIVNSIDEMAIYLHEYDIQLWLEDWKGAVEDDDEEYKRFVWDCLLYAISDVEIITPKESNG